MRRSPRPEHPLAHGVAAAIAALSDVRCSRCFGRVAIAATAWTGRGAGGHVGAHYAATAVEVPHPETHCVCPAGPIAQHLARTLEGEAHQTFVADAMRLFAGDISVGEWRAIVVRAWGSSA